MTDIREARKALVERILEGDRLRMVSGAPHSTMQGLPNR
jgi:hypothetical protein